MVPTNIKNKPSNIDKLLSTIEDIFIILFIFYLSVIMEVNRENINMPHEMLNIDRVEIYFHFQV